LLAVASGRFVLCGTIPETSLPRRPAGRYPAPFVHGARTFLPGGLSAGAGAAVRPTDAIGMGAGALGVKPGGQRSCRYGVEKQSRGKRRQARSASDAKAGSKSPRGLGGPVRSSPRCRGRPIALKDVRPWKPPETRPQYYVPIDR